MSDYTKVYDGAAKDAAEATLAGSDFDTEFSAIETAVATKANKVVTAVANNLLMMGATGDLVDSGIATDGAGVVTLGSPILTTPTLTDAVLNTSISGTAFLDEDNMVSDAANKVASQQSIKAYVDSHFPVSLANGGTGAANYRNAQDNLEIHSLSVNSSSIVYSSAGASGWTFSKIGTGHYRINHYIALGKYAAFATMQDVAGGSATIMMYSSYIDVYCWTSAGTAIDRSANIMLIRHTA